MSLQKLTGARAKVGAIMASKGTGFISGILTGTVSVDPPSIAATTKGSVNATITGLAAGDAVILEPPATLNAGLLFVGYTTAANTVTIYLYNTTGGAVDDTAKTWTYTVLKTS